MKSLVAFPNVLAMMDEKLDWTERLGDAFLSQESEVMDTVQNLRQRASANGTLQSTDQVRIDQEEAKHFDYLAGPTSGVRSLLRSHGHLWPLVVAGLSAGVLATLARLLRGFPAGHRVCVGPGHYGGSRFLLRRLQLAASTGQCGDRQQLLCSQYCHQSLDTQPVHRRGVSYREAALRQQYGRAPAPRRSDRISADTTLRAFPGVARVSSNQANTRSSFAGAVRRCPPPPGFAAANCDLMPSKASAMEDPRTNSEHAAMPVFTVAGAVAAGAEASGDQAITAGDMRLSIHFGRFPFAILTVLFLAMPSAASSEFFVQTTFSSAEEGMQAFVEAITLNDPSVLQTLLGADGLELFDSGDPAADAQWRKRFLKAYADTNKVVLEENNTRAILTVGRESGPCRSR